MVAMGHFSRMKPKRKNLTLGTMMVDARNGFLELVVDRPSAWLKETRSKLDDLPKTNFDLGCHFASLGKWADALLRFRVAAYFAPDYPLVWYNIGCCRFRMGKLEAAIEALITALAQQPNHSETRLMLAAISPASLPAGQLPKRIPADMVARYFSGAAASYDIEESKAKYQGGKAAFDLLKPLLRTPSPIILDIGCGTGIVSRPWRATAASITGLDSTPAMVALADKATHAEKKLFDQLITADVTTPVTALPADHFDAALCINTAQFVGDLSGLFANVQRALAPGGVLLLTAEPFSRAGFGLSADTGRFGHHADYIKQTAKAAGLTVTKEASLMLYPEVSTPTYLFTKAP